MVFFTNKKSSLPREQELFFRLMKQKFFFSDKEVLLWKDFVKIWREVYQK